MAFLEHTSQITFLYFEDLPAAAGFFDDTLELTRVYEQDWVVIWRTGREAFVGAVRADAGSIAVEKRGGVLVSLTVANLDAAYEVLRRKQVEGLSEIKQVKDMGLRSCFFTGPEGYHFEVQAFTEEKLRDIF